MMKFFLLATVLVVAACGAKKNTNIYTAETLDHFSDKSMCYHAYRSSTHSWSTGSSYQRYVLEVQRRKLTLDQCRAYETE